jgi:hypothetical protein
MPINYEMAKRDGPKLKAMLTRAKKKDYSAVLDACTTAVFRWNRWGAWPDNWSDWQRALDDAACKQRIEHSIYVKAPRLEEL